MKKICTTAFVLFSFCSAPLSCSQDPDISVPLYNDWEVTENTPVLDENGDFVGWGWARDPLFEYDRDRVKEELIDRRKEWDFYSISSPDFFMDVTLANISWAVLASVRLIVYSEDGEHTNQYLSSDPTELILPNDPYEDVVFDTGVFFCSFTHEENVRTLTFDFPESTSSPHIQGVITIQDPPENDRMVMSFPFEQEGSFFYTNKFVGLPAGGEVNVNGQSHRFNAEDSMMVLDWGRGVWPEEFEWQWAVVGGNVDGNQIGINIGTGDEDNSRGTSNGIVYNGVLHHFGEIEWSYNPDNIMETWSFISDDGRFEMYGEPFFDNSNTMDLYVYYTSTTQIHGYFHGNVILDNGQRVEFENVIGYAEHCFQRW